MGEKFLYLCMDLYERDRERSFFITHFLLFLMKHYCVPGRFIYRPVK